MTHHFTYRLQLLQLASTRSWSFSLYARLQGSERLVDFGEICALRTEAGSVLLLYGALVRVLRLLQALERLGNFALKKLPIAVHSQCQMSHDTEPDGRHDHMDEPGVNAGHNVIAFRAQRTVLLVSQGSGSPDEGDQIVLLVPHHAVAGPSSLAPDTLADLPHGCRCHAEAELLADLRHGLVQATGRVLRCSADYPVQAPGVLPGLHIVDDVANLAILLRNIMQVIAKSLAHDACGARGLSGPRIVNRGEEEHGDLLLVPSWPLPAVLQLSWWASWASTICSGFGVIEKEAEELSHQSTQHELVAATEVVCLAGRPGFSGVTAGPMPRAGHATLPHASLGSPLRDRHDQWKDW
ncbi:hypothetical protein V5799_021102 [Amblyomma americanum]|uniref:Uncharacterized protein n=1 Tax=Amblyomma americanum TaxID=6943 RepID=A0AAQ4FPI1_AMBAM